MGVRLLQVGLGKSPELPNVPLLLDLVKSDSDRRMLRLPATPSEIAQPFAAPPGLAPAPANLLRRVFDATVAHSAFLAESKKMGLMLSAIVSTMQQAMLYAFVIMMPFALFSGLTTPLSDMPQIFQDMTLINPLRYAIDIAHRVYLEGAGLQQLVPDLWPMAIIASVTLASAAWLFRGGFE